MASLDYIPPKKKGEPAKARFFFRYPASRQHSAIRPVKDRAEADRWLSLIEETILDLGRGKMIMPPDADPKTFILSGGKLAGKPRAAPHASNEAGKPQTLKSVLDHYAANLTPGSKELNTIATEATHRKHFVRVLGGDTIFGSLGIGSLQAYVDRRARAGIKRETIKKELATLRVIWGWAFKRGHVATPLAWKMEDLTLPKTREKEPFQTWDEISRKISQGRFGDVQQRALWDCLWLDQSQTLECLAWVAEHARHPFIPAMFACAAYTGARRSEMIRSEKDDWDFEAGIVSIREKKGDKSRTLQRRNVPIHPGLAEVMRAWFANHPGGHWTFADEDGSPIGENESTRLFRKTVAGGKWSVVRGWHMFRHSLASNLASSGKDQRVINKILGHNTVEMERRYRHLAPNLQADAMNSMFQTKPNG